MRDSIRLTLGLFVLVSALPTMGYAQDAVPGVVPGLYNNDTCRPAPFPGALPLLDAVVDSAALIGALAGVGLEERVVLSLRLGSLDSNPRVRVFKKKGSSELAERVANAVAGSLREAPATEPWAFRLVIDPSPSPVVALERSELCPPVMIPRRRLMRVKVSVRPGELGNMAVVDQTISEQDKLRAAVQLRVLVSAKGRVSKVVMTATSGAPRIDTEEERWARGGTYQPATLDGRPVGIWIQRQGNP